MLTWLEVDGKAIRHNLKQFRRLIGPKVMLMPVVKANAYGHGFLTVAKICDQSPQADRLCVVNLDEALELKMNGIKKPVMILSFFDPDIKKLTLAAKRGVIFPLYDLAQAQLLNGVGERADKKVKVHVKIDTGAARLGISPAAAVDFVKKIKRYKFLTMEGLWSHFASSEENEKYTRWQIKNFQRVVDELKKAGITIPIKHLACSAASVLYPRSRFNAVRLGLSLYGLYPDAKSRRKIKLRPALSWRAKIIQVKNLPACASIGYGGTYITKRLTKLAVIPVGYWDGYDRRLSNNASALIKGQRCPIRGRICMNLSMADVTGVKNVRAGDRATLLGGDGKEKITADDLAKWAGTINYEIVDRINPLLPRILLFRPRRK